MDIGKELRVIDVEHPAIEPVAVETVEVEAPVETSPTTT